jgi:hypothetical protein
MSQEHPAVLFMNHTGKGFLGVQCGEERFDHVAYVVTTYEASCCFCAGLCQMNTSRKVAGSIPGGVIGIFH